MTFIHLVTFHFKQYIKNSYFITVMVASTITLLLLQYISSSALQTQLNNNIWLRTGIFGLWSCGTTAAGIIGMQRWQGTLLYLINNAVSDYQSLAAVVFPASIFGLFSFPIAYFLALILNIPSYFSIEIVLYVIMFWIGAVMLDLVIAAFFVLTPNAIVYEELITLPILLVSGLFTLPEQLSMITTVSGWIIPITLPIQWLLQQAPFNELGIIKFLTSLIITYIISRKITSYLINKARKTGKIGGGI